LDQKLPGSSKKFRCLDGRQRGIALQNRHRITVL
jgi:hypothetical protein